MHAFNRTFSSNCRGQCSWCHAFKHLKISWNLRELLERVFRACMLGCSNVFQLNRCSMQASNLDCMRGVIKTVITVIIMLAGLVPAMIWTSGKW